MTKLIHVTFLIVIACTIIISGCIAPTNKSTTTSGSGGQASNGYVGPSGTDVGTQNSNESKVNSSSPVIPTGSISVSSSPLGAEVFLNETLVGYTPLSLDNMSIGVATISVKKSGYSTSNTTITIVAGNTAKYSVTLDQKAPTLEIRGLNAMPLGACTFNYVGNVANTGSRPAYGVLLTLTLTPKTYDQKAGFVVITQTDTVGVIQSETEVPFGFNDIHVPCNGDYTGTITWNGIDQQNPGSATGNQQITGSYTI